MARSVTSAFLGKDSAARTVEATSSGYSSNSGLFACCRIAESLACRCVAVRPGCTLRTRTPNWLTSDLRLSANALTLCCVAAYWLRSRGAVNPTEELMNTICPSAALSNGKSCRLIFHHLGGLLELPLCPPEQANVRATRPERTRDRSADSATGARDHGYPTIKESISPVDSVRMGGSVGGDTHAAIPVGRARHGRSLSCCGLAQLSPHRRRHHLAVHARPHGFHQHHDNPGILTSSLRTVCG